MICEAVLPVRGSLGPNPIMRLCQKAAESLKTETLTLYTEEHWDVLATA